MLDNGFQDQKRFSSDPKNPYLKFVLYLKHIFGVENELDDVFISEFEDNIKGKVFNFIIYK